jgi:hypothetical protein
MTRKSAPKGASTISPPSSTKAQNTTALLRAEALALGLKAVVAGVWDADPRLIEALAGLASSLTWDLRRDELSGMGS